MAEISVTARGEGGATVQSDRIVYDVVGGASAASFSSIDVVRRLPGINVDSSNVVTIRGGVNVNFLVEGTWVRKEVALAIPANQIARIEVMTNPPAEYDSNGGALINIVLKKNAEAGWNGAISALVDTMGGYKTGLTASHGGEDWTFIGGLTARSLVSRDKSSRQANYGDIQGEGYNTQISNTEDHSSYNQVSAQGKFIRKFSDDESLTIVLNISNNIVPHSGPDDEIFEGPNYYQEQYYHKNVRFDGLYPYISTLYDSKLDESSRLTVSLDGYLGDTWESENISGPTSSSLRDDDFFTYLVGKVEFQKNLTESSLLTTGLNLTRNNVDIRLNLAGFTGSSEDQSDDFKFGREVYAAYTTYQTDLAGIEAKAGLRLERIEQDFGGGVPGLKSVTAVRPSLHLSKPIDEHDTIRASFTIRTEQPDAFLLNPFKKYQSDYFIVQGNTYLRPSAIRQGELGNTYQDGSFALTQTLYYRDTSQDVNSYSVLGPDGTTVKSYANLGTSTAYGYSTAFKDTFFDNLKISYDIDLFHKNISAPAALEQFQGESHNGFDTKIDAEYDPDDSNKFTLNIGYQSRAYTLGVTTPGTWTSELQYEHSFADKLSLTIDLIDIGIPQTLTTYFNSPGFSGSERTYRATERLRVGLSKSF